MGKNLDNVWPRLLILCEDCYILQTTWMSAQRRKHIELCRMNLRIRRAYDVWQTVYNLFHIISMISLFSKDISVVCNDRKTSTFWIFLTLFYVTLFPTNRCTIEILDFSQCCPIINHNVYISRTLLAQIYVHRHYPFHLNTHRKWGVIEKNIYIYVDNSKDREWVVCNTFDVFR